MTPAESAKATQSRHGLWLVVFAVLMLLGISTWDAVQQDSGRALRRAAWEGDVQRIEKILQRHPDLANSRGGKSLRTRLLEAAPKWADERLQRLKWNEFEGGESAGFSALHWASARTNLAAVRILLAAGASPDLALDRGDTPLGFAIDMRNTEVVHALVEAGANLNLTSPPRANALAATILNRGDGATNITVLLLERGANPNPSLTKGTTPLHWAAGRGQIETIRLLVRAGAKLNATNNEGWTPLDYAIKENKTNAIALLLSLGATP